MQVGHMQLETDGRICQVDDEICAMLSQTAGSMLGRSVIDITYPPDRAVCRRSMRMLCETRRPFAVVKRMIRGDGSPLWVSKTVALATFGDAAAPVLATITRGGEPCDGAKAHERLRQARRLVADLRERREWLKSPIFVDPPSSILLSAYVAETEGTLADIDTMAADAGVPASVLVRWIRAMAAEGLIEEEGRTEEGAFGYRLTQQALDRCERYLTHRLHACKPGPAGS